MMKSIFALLPLVAFLNLAMAEDAVDPVIEPVIIVEDTSDIDGNFNVSVTSVLGDDEQAYKAVKLTYNEQERTDLVIHAGRTNTWNQANEMCEKIRPTFRLVTQTEFVISLFAGYAENLGPRQVYDLGPDNWSDGKMIHFFEYSGVFEMAWFSNDLEFDEVYVLYNSDVVYKLDEEDGVVSLQEEIDRVAERIRKIENKEDEFAHYGPAQLEGHKQTLALLQQGVDVFCIEVTK